MSSRSSVGRAVVLCAICRGFKPHREYTFISKRYEIDFFKKKENYTFLVFSEMREKEILQLMAIYSVLNRMDARHIISLILRYYSGYMTVVYDSKQPYHSHCLDEVLRILGNEYGNNFELFQGNLGGILKKPILPDIVGMDTIVFQNFYPYNTVMEIPPSLDPWSAAGLVNNALSSIPEKKKVRVQIESRMSRGEEGWKIFFKTISCLERVMFDISRSRVRGKEFTPSNELLKEIMGYNIIDFGQGRRLTHPDFE